MCDWLSVYKRPFHQIVESNRIESKNRFVSVNRIESNRIIFPRIGMLKCVPLTHFQLIFWRTMWTCMLAPFITGMLEYSFPRLFVPWNIRSLDRSFPATFIPGKVRSLDHSFPRPNITQKIHSLDYNRSNTSFILYVKWWSLEPKY